MSLQGGSMNLFLPHKWRFSVLVVVLVMPQWCAGHESSETMAQKTISRADTLMHHLPSRLNKALRKMDRARTVPARERVDILNSLLQQVHRKIDVFNSLHQTLEEMLVHSDYLRVRTRSNVERLAVRMSSYRKVALTKVDELERELMRAENEVQRIVRDELESSVKRYNRKKKSHSLPPDPIDSLVNALSLSGEVYSDGDADGYTYAQAPAPQPVAPPPLRVARPVQSGASIASKVRRELSKDLAWLLRVAGTVYGAVRDRIICYFRTIGHACGRVYSWYVTKPQEKKVFLQDTNDWRDVGRQVKERHLIRAWALYKWSAWWVRTCNSMRRTVSGAKRFVRRVGRVCTTGIRCLRMDIINIGTKVVDTGCSICAMIYALPQHLVRGVSAVGNGVGRVGLAVVNKACQDINAVSMGGLRAMQATMNLVGRIWRSSVQLIVTAARYVITAVDAAFNIPGKVVLAVRDGVVSVCGKMCKSTEVSPPVGESSASTRSAASEPTRARASLISTARQGMQRMTTSMKDGGYQVVSTARTTVTTLADHGCALITRIRNGIGSVGAHVFDLACMVKQKIGNEIWRGGDAIITGAQCVTAVIRRAIAWINMVVRRMVSSLIQCTRSLSTKAFYGTFTGLRCATDATCRASKTVMTTTVITTRSLWDGFRRAANVTVGATTHAGGTGVRVVRSVSDGVVYAMERVIATAKRCVLTLSVGVTSVVQALADITCTFVTRTRLFIQTIWHHTKIQAHVYIVRLRTYLFRGGRGIESGATKVAETTRAVQRTAQEVAHGAASGVQRTGTTMLRKLQIAWCRTVQMLRTIATGLKKIIDRLCTTAYNALCVGCRVTKESAQRVTTAAVRTGRSMCSVARTATERTYGGVKKAATATGTGVTGAAMTLQQQLRAVGKKIYDAFCTVLHTIMSVMQRITAVTMETARSFGASACTTATAAGNMIMNTTQRAGSTMVSGAQRATSALSNSVHRAGTLSVAAGRAVTNAATRGYHTAVDHGKRVAHRVGSTFSTGAHDIEAGAAGGARAIGNGTKKIGTLASRVTGGVRHGVSQASEHVRKGLSRVASGARHGASRMRSGVCYGASCVSDGVKSGASWAAGSLQRGVSRVGSIASQVGSSARQSLSSAADNLRHGVSRVSDGARHGVSRIGSVVSRVGNSVRYGAQQAVTQVRNAAQAAVQAVQRGTQAVTQHTAAGTKTISTRVRTTAQNLWQCTSMACLAGLHWIAELTHALREQFVGLLRRAHAGAYSGITRVKQAGASLTARVSNWWRPKYVVPAAVTSKEISTAAAQHKVKPQRVALPDPANVVAKKVVTSPAPSMKTSVLATVIRMKNKVVQFFIGLYATACRVVRQAMATVGSTAYGTWNHVARSADTVTGTVRRQAAAVGQRVKNIAGSSTGWLSGGAHRAQHAVGTGTAGALNMARNAGNATRTGASQAFATLQNSGKQALAGVKQGWHTVRDMVVGRPQPKKQYIPQRMAPRQQ